MVSICIVGILASVAIPFYISYVQQARVVSIIIPKLHLIETNISLYYSMTNELPGDAAVAGILKDIDTEHCDISLTNGTILLKIDAPDSSSKLNILNGKILIASPVITKFKIVNWHLSGELAERLKINY
jgi:type IV pilus assembly protein PilA